MKALIIEDEYPAAEKLQKLIRKVAPQIEIVGSLDSVETALQWFANQPAPDLIFSDIQLSDGLSFEIFEKITTPSPIIFTTSYDEYAIKAFKLRSIDYLLKPIKLEELKEAIGKYTAMKSEFSATEHLLRMQALLDNLPASNRKHKERFLVKSQEQLILISADQIAYFQTANEWVCMVCRNNKKYLVDYTLEQLENLLDPNLFFRINRQFIAQLGAIRHINTYFNGKLLLILEPVTGTEVLVSREKAQAFKDWMEGNH